MSVEPATNEELNAVKELLESHSVDADEGEDLESHESAMKDLEDRFNKRVQELVSQGYTPRKAKRYLNSIAGRQVKKMIRRGKRRK